MRDLSAAQAGLTQQQIELPSWAFGNTGTRFKVFGQPGVPRTPWEKAEDAAQVHRYTSVAPSMAVHIPWDKVDDYAALARHADSLRIRIGTVNANVFQDDDYKLGSACHPDPRVRKKAVAHLLECVDVMDATGSRDLKLWFADGTNYPGQDDIRARQDRLAEALAFAGPSNVAYGAAKADQAHQVRLLAAELGEIGVRVNGVNPDGVVRGSGIFASGWGAQRAAVYGVPEDELGAFYARRTLVKREVLPEHVAAAVLALCAGDLALTTGLLIPLDAGVAAVFLR